MCADLIQPTSVRLHLSLDLDARRPDPPPPPIRLIAMLPKLKGAIETSLVRSGAGLFGSIARGPQTLILAYHNIVPRGEALSGEVDLQVDQRVFGTHLDLIQDVATVLPLRDVLAPRGSDDRGPRVAITFDDAYVGAMSAGVAELQARGLPATVFVPPGLLGSEGFWWDQLTPSNGRLPSEVREHALGELAGDRARVIEWATQAGLTVQSVLPHARPVTEAGLFQAAQGPHMSLGAHTWDHPNLAKVPIDRAIDEMTRSRDWLRDNMPHYVNWLAYPYGMTTRPVVDAARELFDGALLVEGGLAERRETHLHPVQRTPRLNVSRKLSVDGLALRLHGLLLPTRSAIPRE